MIRAVVFDIDGTLIDHIGAERAAVRSLFGSLRRLIPCPSVEEFAQVWHAEAERHMRLHLAGELTFAEQRVKRVQSVFARWGRVVSDEEAMRVFGEYLRWYEENWRLYEDVLPCLRSLNDYRLGIVSNGDGEQQRNKLRCTGIASFFSSTVISGDTGVAKPKAAIFERSLHDLALSAEEAVYVGDCLELDPIGASQAGLRGVWLDRSGVSRNVNPSVITIASLEELPDVVGGM